MLAESVVHTEGVNWELVIAIVTCVVTTMTVVFGLFARYVSGQITGAINQFRIEILQKMENRLTVLEVLAGLRKGKPRDDPSDV
jgi:hypothetical protein